MDQLEGELIGTGSPTRNSMHESRKGAARREAAIDSRFHAVDLKKIEFPVPSKELLARAFNLSPAEIRLAQHLARGESLEEIAPRVGVKLSTARSQLSIRASSATQLPLPLRLSSSSKSTTAATAEARVSRVNRSGIRNPPII